MNYGISGGCRRSAGSNNESRGLGVLRAAVVFAVLLGVNSVANAQETVETINQETARLQAEAARINARAALEAAERARLRAVDVRLPDIQGQLALETARQQLADAGTNSSIAQSIGTVRNASYTGAVELKDKAGMLEARLLAMKAVADAAIGVSGEIGTVVTGRPVVIAAGTDFKSPERISLYRFRVDMLKKVLLAALAGDESTNGTEAAAAIPAVVSAGLEAAGKLLSFFKTDFTVGGIDVAVDESVALYAVSGALAKEGNSVRWPALHMPEQRQLAVQSILQDMTDLITLRQRVEAKAIKAASDASRAEREASKAQDSEKAEIALEVSEYRATEVRMKTAMAAYDTFAASLTTSTGTGPEPLADLISDMGLAIALKTSSDDAAKGPLLLLVRLEHSGGGYLLKKNLLTGLGAPPLYHMGGAAISYLLVDGQTGMIMRGGTVARHGGYTKSSKMRESLGN